MALCHIQWIFLNLDINFNHSFSTTQFGIILNDIFGSLPYAVGLVKLRQLFL